MGGGGSPPICLIDFSKHFRYFIDSNSTIKEVLHASTASKFLCFGYCLGKRSLPKAKKLESLAHPMEKSG